MKRFEKEFLEVFKKSQEEQYDMYYKLLDSGKESKARKYLNSLVSQQRYAVLYICPKCGERLFRSDIPNKDFVCLPCMKYYTNESLLGSTTGRFASICELVDSRTWDIRDIPIPWFAGPLGWSLGNLTISSQPTSTTEEGENA